MRRYSMRHASGFPILVTSFTWSWTKRISIAGCHTEVAFFFGGFVSRLRITRNQIRFILTSASLAEGGNAEVVIRHFADQLTGIPAAGTRFSVIQGVLDPPANYRQAKTGEADAFAAFPIDHLIRQLGISRTQLKFQALAAKLGYSGEMARDSEGPLQESVFMTSNPPGSFGASRNGMADAVR